MVSADNSAWPQLPIELWEEIVILCAGSDQITLCKISKKFNSLAIRTFYREVELWNPKQTIGCCRTLSRNSSAALSVRKFRIRLGSVPDYAFPAFYNVLRSALRAVTNTDVLHLHGGPDEIPADYYFPSLRTFVCSIPYSSTTTAFLQRHPNIETLYLQSGHFYPHVISQIHLPHLISFMGPSQVLSALIIGPSVHDALIGWQKDADASHFNTALRALAPSSSSIERLGSSLVFWYPQLLPVIAYFFPNLLSLRLHAEAFDPDMFNDGVEACLAEMKQLRRLILSYPHSLPLTEEICDRDMKMLISWGNICPSLNSCHFFSGTTWLRLDSVVWLPTTFDPVVSAWWHKMVLFGGLDDIVAGSTWIQLAPHAVTMVDKRELLIGIQRQLTTSIGA